MDQAQLYQNWLVPFISVGRECGVVRSNAVDAIKRIYSHGFILLGYAAFTVFPDGKRQPRTDFCASCFVENQPSVLAAIDSVKNHPLQVTHYVFIFKASAKQNAVFGPCDEWAATAKRAQVSHAKFSS